MCLEKNKLKLSIRMQVICWYMGILVIVMACSAMIMQKGFVRLCAYNIENNLRNNNKLIYYQIKNGEKPGIVEEEIDLQEEEAVLLYDANGTNIYESSSVAEKIKALPLSEGNVQNINIDGKAVYLYDTFNEISEGEWLWIRSYVMFDSIMVIDKSIYQVIGATIPIVLIGAILGGILITKKIFHPIHQLYDTAKQISESGDMTKRIEILYNKDDEISRLTNMFNTMFERLSDSFETERQFTMDASHELRTPLTVIHSQAQYLEEYYEVDSQEGKAIGTILKQTKYMNRLVNSLLLIARMENNTDLLQVEEVELSELILTIIEEMQEQAEEKEITISHKIQSNVTIQADQGMIVRILINLISNAIQYGRQGGYIRVSLEQVAGQVKVSIEDNGIGISKEQLPKIWNRFYQVDTTAKSSNNSMGLGLFMVKKMIELHHGSITVESELGEGTKFIFFL